MTPPLICCAEGRLEQGGAIGVVVRRVEDMPDAAVVVNSEDEVTAAAFIPYQDGVDHDSYGRSSRIA